MDINSNNSISGNLLNRNVFSVCYTGSESIEEFHNELYELRKNFFTSNTHKLHDSIEFCGYEGKVRGTIRKHSLHWKKTANKVAVQEAFLVQGTYVVVNRDLNGRIIGKVHFDKNMLWLKTEYFGGDDPIEATLIFKPVETTDAIEKFTYNSDTKNYISELLFPVPYMHSTPEQSVINARHGDELLLVATGEGEFAYCTKAEKEERLKSIAEVNDGTIMMMPAWEVKEGEIPETARQATPVFTDLFNPAEDKTEDTSEQKPPIDSENHVSEAQIDENAGAVTEDDLKLTVENTQEITEVKRAPVITADMEYNYTGRLIDGKRVGRGRTDQPNGLTAYDGEYAENMKNGFGSSYYKNGNLSYVGGWKDDNKDGVGISFRKKDHAMQVCKWTDGKPEAFTTLFDTDGNLRYSGKIVDGKKTGVGVSYRKRDGSVFVGKWDEGKQIDFGSLFDADGNLIYTGGWKNGMKNGTGTEFDTMGQIVYSGQWQDDKYLNGILYQKI